MKDIAERCLELSISLLNYLNKEKTLNQIIVRQLTRSATSIGSNIVEGRSGTRKELIRFYNIALRSGNESKYWIKILIGCNENNKTELNNFYKEIEEITKIIAKSIITLKSNSLANK